jgi:hypothetical protein
MKKIAIFALALLLTAQLAAQKDTTAYPTQNNCYHSLYVYGSIGAADIMLNLIQFGYEGTFRFGHYDAGILYNFHFNRHWSVGVGTEFHGSNGLWCFGGLWGDDLVLYLEHKDFLTLPVYANFRYTIGNRAVKPILELKAGYAFPLRTVIANNYADANTPATRFLQGPITAGGFYAGMAAGIHVRKCHNITLGASVMPVTADLLYSDGENLYKKGLMWNFYVRYGFNILYKLYNLEQYVFGTD